MGYGTRSQARWGQEEEEPTSKGHRCVGEVGVRPPWSKLEHKQSSRRTAGKGWGRAMGKKGKNGYGVGREGMGMGVMAGHKVRSHHGSIRHRHGSSTQ